MSQDSTRTIEARQQSKSTRVDLTVRASQARLADKSFSDFMRKHNQAVKAGA